ncbi:LysR family transcriptional regulator [Vibrio cholerae]
MKSQLDLNLLKVLLLLAKHKQLKPVAKELGKTESAVSKHLAKLREQLDDPLFVRGAHEFEPTEFTLKLLPGVEQGLELIQYSVQDKTFEPQLYQKPIKIALPSVVQYLVGKDLLIDLLDTFPRASIDITTWNDYSVSHILDDKVDIGVQYFNGDLTKNLYQQRLGQCDASIICAKRYAGRTLDDLLAMPFVLMEMKGWQHSKAATKVALAERGVAINDIATVDNMTCLFEVLDEIECAAFLPKLPALTKRPNLAVTVLPDSLMGTPLPPIVSISRLKNRGGPLHDLLVSKLKQHVFSS